MLVSRAVLEVASSGATLIKFKAGLQKIVIDVSDDALEEQSPPIDSVLDSLHDMLGADYV